MPKKKKETTTYFSGAHNEGAANPPDPASQDMEGSQVGEGEAEVDLKSLMENIETLQQELAGLQAQSDEYLDGWQRARADFANYKKRVERDQSLSHQAAKASVIKRFLEIIDDLERALQNRPQDGDGATWANGIELIYRKFLSYLETEEITPIPAEGELFDPNLHEAISQEESSHHESGQVIGVVQQGYQMGERVIRPARVRVAR